MSESFTGCIGDVKALRPCRWGWALAGLLGCGPNADAQVATADAGTETMSETGAAVGAACGPDGIAAGPVPIRDNDDALALVGCTVVDGDLLIDPCRLCLDGDRGPCVQCGDPEVLTSIAGLESLERVTGNLYIGRDVDPLGNEDRSGHERLASIVPLARLRRVDGDLHLGHAPLLASAAFPALEHVGGELRIADSFPVDADLPALREVGELSLEGASRTTFAFPSLERVHDSLSLFETRIADLDGIPRLKALGSVTIVGDEELGDLAPLLRVPISGSLTAFSLPRLTTLEVLHAGPGSSIAVHHCPVLERVTIPADVEVMADLSFENNDALTTLDFPALIELTPGGLGLWDNDALDSLTGLASLQFVDSSITLVGNPRICQSEVDAFIEGLQFGDQVSHWQVEPNGDC